MNGLMIGLVKALSSKQLVGTHKCADLLIVIVENYAHVRIFPFVHHHSTHNGYVTLEMLLRIIRDIC
jgi:hypothetical protein